MLEGASEALFGGSPSRTHSLPAEQLLKHGIHLVCFPNMFDHVIFAGSGDTDPPTSSSHPPGLNQEVLQTPSPLRGCREIISSEHPRSSSHIIMSTCPLLTKAVLLMGNFDSHKSIYICLFMHKTSVHFINTGMNIILSFSRMLKIHVLGPIS